MQPSQASFAPVDGSVRLSSAYPSSNCTPNAAAGMRLSAGPIATKNKPTHTSWWLYFSLAGTWANHGHLRSKMYERPSTASVRHLDPRRPSPHIPHTPHPKHNLTSQPQVGRASLAPVERGNRRCNQHLDCLFRIRALHWRGYDQATITTTLMTKMSDALAGARADGGAVATARSSPSGSQSSAIRKTMRGTTVGSKPGDNRVYRPMFMHARASD
ncbi:hypothetical protein C8Q72DRAFT_793801 [Fomitopsis betulina]|nr:hypothetical protein C8Q72DRAFT_793801 [Fomitopsis betulina]